MKHFDELVLRLFGALAETILQETNGFRDRRLIIWRTLDYYWHGKQFLDQEGRITGEGISNRVEEDTGDEDQQSRKVINIFRARGESLISALSNHFPNVYFYPSDANDAESVNAATAKNRLAKRIINANNPELFLARAFYILYEQDFLACWNRPARDYKYGTDRVQEQRPLDECPECRVETAPNGYCPECEEFKLETTERKQPRAMQELMLYGPRNVIIPPNTREVSKIPYVMLRELIPTSYLRWKYNEHAEEIEADHGDADSTNALYTYTTDYEERGNTTILTTLWLKPWALYMLEAEHMEAAKKILQKYPDGVRITMVKGTVLEVMAEDLQKVWTFTQSPMSKTIHDDPIGKILVDTQDLLNETYNLTVDTIAQGIPDLFVDPSFLDPEKYANRRAIPGSIIIAKGTDGKSMAEGFYTPTPARLSEEVTHFNTRLEGASQELSGATPAIYGGQIKGSRTAAEYSMSREQALERLNVKYRMAKDFIATLIPKAVSEYAKNMVMEEETHVNKRGEQYENETLEREDLLGETGRVEVEGGSHVPMSWAQIKSSIMELLGSGNQFFQQMFQHPQNALLVKQVVGVNDLYVPGEQGRTKQWYEIGILKEGAPAPSPENPAELRSSVPTIPGVDEDEVELEICRVWLTSDEGLHYRETKPEVYENVQLHAQEHAKNLVAMQQSPGPGPEQGPQPGPQPGVPTDQTVQRGA